DVTRITVVERRIGMATMAGELRLDDFDKDVGIAPGIIKIDVDGYEVEVLNGGSEIFRRPNVDVLVETPNAVLENEFTRLLRSFGFSTKVIKNGWYRWFLPENRPGDHNRWLWASKR